MLSSVLRSERAVQVNIEIVGAFVRLRTMLAGNVELARKLAALERNTTRNLDAHVPRGRHWSNRRDDAAEPQGA
jgi:hypothetical protein